MSLYFIPCTFSDKSVTVFIKSVKFPDTSFISLFIFPDKSNMLFITLLICSFTFPDKSNMLLLHCLFVHLYFGKPRGRYARVAFELALRNLELTTSHSGWPLPTADNHPAELAAPHGLGNSIRAAQSCCPL